MSRSNVYALICTDTGRHIGIGGARGTISRMEVWLNTDNAGQSNCSLNVTARVSGPGLSYKERRRKNGDGRRTEFTMRLPEQVDRRYCTVDISLEASVQCPNVDDQTTGIFEKQVLAKGRKGFKSTTNTRARSQVLRAFRTVSTSLSANIPHTLLPFGGTLAEAMAALIVMRRLQALGGIEDPIPPCVEFMHCLCAGHARGITPDQPCDTNE